jgi:two-component system chemotaxis sensor kinase CheA
MTAQGPASGLSPETLAAIRIVFFQECATHLADLKAGLTVLQNGGRTSETVNGAYRAAHSIKGGAGLFQLDELVRFSGQIETVLGEVRDGRLAPGPEVLSLLGRASHELADLVEAAREGRDLPPEPTAALGQALVALAPSEAEPSAFDALNFEPRALSFRPIRRSGAGEA